MAIIRRSSRNFSSVVRSSIKREETSALLAWKRSMLSASAEVESDGRLMNEARDDGVEEATPGVNESAVEMPTSERSEVLRSDIEGVMGRSLWVLLSINRDPTRPSAPQKRFAARKTTNEPLLGVGESRLIP